MIKLTRANIFGAIKYSSIVAVCCFIVSCSSMSGTDKPEAVKYSLSINAGADINPSELSPSNPVVLHLYQLNALEPFKSAQIIDLFQRDATLLADTLVQKTSLNSLLPGEQRSVEISIQPGAIYLAVIAEFSNYAQAKTKAWVDISKLDEINRLVVSVNLLTVSIQSYEQDDSWWDFW